MNPGTLLVGPQDTWAQFAAETLADRLQKSHALHSDDRLAVALAGGSTPAPVYEALARRTPDGLRWDRFDLFLSDERMVPLDHEESNYLNAKRHLCDRLKVERPTLHPVETDRPPSEAADLYADQIRRHVPSGPDGTPAFDLVLLGVGGDGHTASLFPNQPTLREVEKIVLAARHPQTGQRRVTFSVPLLAAAHLVVFMVAGTVKKDVMTRVYRSGEDPALPAALVAHRAREVLWLIDEPAAAGILKTGRDISVRNREARR